MSLSMVARSLAAVLQLLPSPAVRACWRRGSHTWETDMCDATTCRDCGRRQYIPRDPFNFGD